MRGQLSNWTFNQLTFERMFKFQQNFKPFDKELAIKWSLKEVFWLNGEKVGPKN